MFRAPLQGLSESKKFRAWTKCKDSRRATRFAQTISPSALTSLPGTSRFTKTLPKSPCPHPPVPQKGSRNGACFLLYRQGKSSNNQLRKSKARSESFTNDETSKSRCFAFLSVYFASLSFRWEACRKRSGCLDESFWTRRCAWHVTLEESAGTS